MNNKGFGKIDKNPDYMRAIFLLKNRIKYPIDLIHIWSVFGPCIEPHPSIEDLRQK